MRRDSLELALISLANHGLAFARGRQRTIRTTFSIWLSPFVIFTYQVFFIIRRMRLDYSHTIFSMALRIWQVISCIQRFHLDTLFNLRHNTARLQCGYLPWMAPSRPVWQLVSLHRTWTMTGHLLGQFLPPPTPFPPLTYRRQLSCPGGFWFYVGLDSDPEPAGFSCLLSAGGAL